MLANQSKWDNRFLELTTLIGSWSKDDSHQVGAVIVDNSNRIISTGYNGPPASIDYVDQTKQIVIHAEVNAILFAKQDLTNCTLYVTPFMPCASCAAIIAQSGIKRVVTKSLELKQKFAPDETLKLFKKLKIEIVCL